MTWQASYPVGSASGPLGGDGINALFVRWYVCAQPTFEPDTAPPTTYLVKMHMVGLSGAAAAPAPSHYHRAAGSFVCKMPNGVEAWRPRPKAITNQLEASYRKCPTTCKRDVQVPNGLAAAAKDVARETYRQPIIILHAFLHASCRPRTPSQAGLWIYFAK